MSTLTSLKTQERLLDRQAANSIRQQIVNRTMPPGHRLLEAVLARELEVSRGTIRSALMQLSNEGLVRQVAFTKWEVAPASVEEAWELYTLRSALEGLAASLAAQYASPAERDGLSRVFAELEAAANADQREAAADADFKLHKTIVAMSGHKRLIRDHERIILQVRFQMTHIGFAPRETRDLIDDHRDLTEAVLKGDAARAEQLARTHNSAEVKRLLDANARQPSSGTPGANTKKGD
ncbi:GntR family transcriptional regulator [Bauldia litoralis]|uniref:DNA-binding transcriptional regulator, GntR family n=1 Tax=Bauldia litoralis TaxID=665467 RepID=A0A1G6DVD6_9HYPH|nr:GntR family transcriptional regulator [Bauldia litoralis]SDB49091.1 DNA-binding transcriptional regulator, GntR family [Bauldia litoralis]